MTTISLSPDVDFLLDEIVSMEIACEAHMHGLGPSGGEDWREGCDEPAEWAESLTCPACGVTLHLLVCELRRVAIQSWHRLVHKPGCGATTPDWPVTHTRIPDRS